MEMMNFHFGTHSQPRMFHSYISTLLTLIVFRIRVHKLAALKQYEQEVVRSVKCYGVPQLGTGGWICVLFLRLLLFDLFCRFMGFIYMYVRRPDKDKGRMPLL